MTNPDVIHDSSPGVVTCLPMTAVHPLGRAWITTGGTGARNYDEFADEAEITEIVSAAPHSALGVEMPHRAPDSAGQSFTEALPQAVERLAAAKVAGGYRPEQEVVVAYRITDHGTGTPAYGLFAMVDTSEISTSADEPGRVIRNEDVFPEKVRERVALLQATGHLMSPVLLMQTERSAELEQALAEAVDTMGESAAADTDHAGRSHELWPVPPGELADRLTALAGTGELVVADGNHRSLAAQTAGLDRFLAVVTTPGSLVIAPYHRLLTELPVAPADLRARLEDAGAVVEPVADMTAEPLTAGTVLLYAEGRAIAVRLPAVQDSSVVDRLDHALVERVLFNDALGMDAGDKRIRYIGGDYPVDWLVAQVDQGLAALAVLIAPVSVEDFVEVNLARQRMPRKSTWFIPKSRAGLVLAELGTGAVAAAAIGQGDGQAGS